MRHLFVTAALVAVSSVPVFAQDDAEGAKDHPVLARLAGYYISAAEVQEFGAYEFTMADGNGKKVEGRYWEISYWLKDGAKNPGALAIARNYSNAMIAKKGRKILEDVDAGGGRSTVTMPLGDGRTLWVDISVSNGGETYTLTVVEEAAMNQQIAITAEWLAEQLAKSGSVALEGITFDTAKAVIKPESKTVLDQIGALLTNDAALRLEIQGHTDNVGAPTANLALSQQRAEAVRKYLVDTHGIAAARLTTAGFGDTRPVADNATEDGRAKNRRVELHRKSQ
jgi:outer membrane protein OmpA-like peptidoglycan-associated protein